MKVVLPSERVERTILLICGHKVMLDRDLAHLYGVTTKRLNEQVKRNRNRFPVDFMFHADIKRESRGGRKLRPPRNIEVFKITAICFYRTRRGQVASVLNSKRAIEVTCMWSGRL